MLTLLGIAFGTAVLSGVFGMAGGMLLMGAYTAALPVEAGIALHGIVQGTATGARAAILWRHADRRALLTYAAGAAGAWLLLQWWRPTVEARAVWLCLGLMPYAAEIAGRYLPLPDIGARPIWGVAAGFLVNGTQGIAGVAGPLLDLFFVRGAQSGTMPPRAVVATKALTQSLSHTLKALLYLDAATRLPPALILGSLVASLVGTAVGTRLLAALPDRDFRRGTRLLLLAVGAIYLWKAL